MSPSGHSAIGFTRFDMRPGDAFEDHAHDVHQLAWARQGAVTVRVAERHWVLPSALALWVPAGTVHASIAVQGAVLQGIYLCAERCRVDWPAPTVVAVSPLLRSLIEYLDGDVAEAARIRAEGVLLDLLTPVTLATIDLPVPTDDRALLAARALLERPADDRGLSDWARLARTSPRTLSRIFSVQTGLSFSDWRTRARLQVALELLAAGRSVGQVSREVGYTTSAFVAAFRRLTGQTPGAYFGDATS